MTELMTEVASNLWRVSGCNEVKRDRRSPTRPKRFEVSESDSPGVVRPESEVNQWSEKQVKSRSWALRWAIWWFWCDLYWCINDIQTLFDTHYYHYSFNFFGSISTCQFWSSSVPASWTLLPQDVKFHRGSLLAVVTLGRDRRNPRTSTENRSWRIWRGWGRRTPTQLMANDPSLVPGPFSERFILDMSRLFGESHSDNSDFEAILNSCSQMCHKSFTIESLILHTPACTPRASESLRFVGPSRAKDHRSQKMKPARGIWDPNGIAMYIHLYIQLSCEFQLYIQFRIHPLRWASPSWDDGILQIPSISVGEKFQHRHLNMLDFGTCPNH